jgi:hypothetical protein
MRSDGAEGSPVANRYMLGSKLSEEAFEALIACYAREVSSGAASRQTGVSAKTIKAIYQVFTNCLFSAWFRTEQDEYLTACLKEYIKTGVSQMDAEKYCVLYCPAIINNATCARGACHVCPRGHSLVTPPANWKGPGRTIFLNRKFLAALEGYHLIARLHYFVVVDAMLKEDALHKRAPGLRLSKAMREFFERYPVDLRLFAQCWDGRVNRYYGHNYHSGGAEPLRPRAKFRPQD